MSREKSYREQRALRQAEDMLSVSPYVFVYGTLKRGLSNNSWLGKSLFKGADTTKEGWLLGKSGIPYAFPPSVVPDEYKELLRPIRGDVFKVTDNKVARSLDVLEGYDENPDHAHYYRRVIETTGGITAWIYTQEDFQHAYRCYQCTITKEGEWQWP